MGMKKYTSLGELLLDYRNHHNLTQLDMAERLHVDVRTISRWEKGDSLIKTEKEDEFVNALFIPHQVIHNLNSEHPITIFYDIENRTYSISMIGTEVVNTELFKSAFPIDEEHIHHLDPEQDKDFIHNVQALRTDEKVLETNILKESSKLLEELNLIIFDQAGYYAGHLAFIPLKRETYERIRNREMEEYEITLDDIDREESEHPRVFYFYSLYADSIAHSYYLASRVLRYFKMQKFKDYIVAGHAHSEAGLNMHKEMGLKVVYEKEDNVGYNAFLMEGTYDMYLFGKML